MQDQFGLMVDLGVITICVDVEPMESFALLGIDDDEKFRIKAKGQSLTRIR
jgi:hypothetical protein